MTERTHGPTDGYKDDLKKQARKLHQILRDHWCDQYPHGDTCKHCHLETKICMPIHKILHPKIVSEILRNA